MPIVCSVLHGERVGTGLALLPRKMLAWTASFVFGGLLARELSRSPALAVWRPIRRERERLARVLDALWMWEETLAAGLLPETTHWQRLRALPEPWGELIESGLQELRASGAALLPTLKRFRGLALDEDATLVEAQARTGQALAQALFCAGLVPVFGAVLYALLPGLNEHAGTWAGVCMLSLGGALGGARWMIALAEQARWGGLAVVDRPAVLAAFSAGEAFLAWIRSGSPADLAWIRAWDGLHRRQARLARAWGASVWEDGTSGVRASKVPAFEVLARAGENLKRAVQASLMEGRPCAERVEAALAGTRKDFRAQVDRELASLATRSLRPLMGCVAPAIFVELLAALWLSWERMS